MNGPVLKLNAFTSLVTVLVLLGPHSVPVFYPELLYRVGEGYTKLLQNQVHVEMKL